MGRAPQAKTAKYPVWVIPTNEELMIARHTAGIASATVQ
jgi:acetate kinase